MPYLHLYRLFLSHAWAYSDGYNRIRQFLDAAPNFSYANYSVPIDQAFANMKKSDLEEQLRQQIRPVHTVVILGGMYVSHSDWIQFEISFAKSLNKPILGIMPWGGERMPTAVTTSANKIVGWNTTAIVAGIREITP
jgi:hypothetical protein